MKPVRLLFRPLAEVQILETFNTYRLSSPRHAQEWMNAVDDVLTAVEHYPFLHQVIFDDVHRARVGKFPYLLLYNVAEVVIG